MSDKVIGIAVLDRISPLAVHQTEILHLVCVFKNGQNLHQSIPVRHRSLTEPAHAWCYDITGDTLNLTPSLKVSTTRPSKTNPEIDEEVELFHNDGAWSVRFVEFQPGEYVQAYDLFKAINADLLKFPDCA